MCIISGGSNEGVRIRLRRITDIHLGTPNKVETFKEYTDVYTINPEHVLYMGDDIPDYHVMKLVGLAACPQDVQKSRRFLSIFRIKNGGKGAARDVIEQVMKTRDDGF
jgi:3-deoxy-D-manno-octulosonate 8-phosphate phosphatase (KDO 8-P phosphatase)